MKLNKDKTTTSEHSESVCVCVEKQSGRERVKVGVY